MIQFARQMTMVSRPTRFGFGPAIGDRYLLPLSLDRPRFRVYQLVWEVCSEIGDLLGRGALDPSGSCRQIRSIMSDDIGDGGLIDVSGFSLSELSDEVDQSALDHALRRILASSEERERHNFQAII